MPLAGLTTARGCLPVRVGAVSRWVHAPLVRPPVALGASLTSNRLPFVDQLTKFDCCILPFEPRPAADRGHFLEIEPQTTSSCAAVSAFRISKRIRRLLPLSFRFVCPFSGDRFVCLTRCPSLSSTPTQHPHHPARRRPRSTTAFLHPDHRGPRLCRIYRQLRIVLGQSP
jgi:hypothetical protein